jgi:TrmH family RNA methyltransferase
LPLGIERTEHAGVLTKADLQRLRSLREKKHREALGLFVIEGEKVVAELLAAQFPLVEIYATPAWIAPILPRSASSPRSVSLTKAEMARASHYPTPSSVLAVGRIQRLPLTPEALREGLTLMLDGVQDAGNVGTLLRIADWFAFDRVVLSPDCADVFNQKVINSSMGSFVRLPVLTGELAPALRELRRAGAQLPILGCDLEGDNVHTLPALPNAVVIVGSEGRGLSAAVAQCVTQRVTIPRFGHAESLNAGVAAAIVCDNLRRALSQR